MIIAIILNGTYKKFIKSQSMKVYFLTIILNGKYKKMSNWPKKGPKIGEIVYLMFTYSSI